MCALAESTDIDSRIALLFEQRDRLRSNIQRFLESREQTTANIKSLNIEIREIRSKKDSLLGGLRQIREEQGAQRGKVQEYGDKLQVLLSKYRHTEGDPYKAYEGLTEKISHIEWKLQTEPLQRKDERAVISTIKELQLKRKELEKQIENLGELNDLQTLERQAGAVLKEIREKGGQMKIELNDLDKELDTLMRERSDLARKVEAIDKEIFENAKTLGENNRALAELRKQEEKISFRTRSRFEADRRKLLEDARDDAMQKLSKGSKLSFDELKLVMSSEMDNTSSNE